MNRIELCGDIPVEEGGGWICLECGKWHPYEHVRPCECGTEKPEPAP